MFYLEAATTAALTCKTIHGSVLSQVTQLKDATCFWFPVLKLNLPQFLEFFCTQQLKDAMAASDDSNAAIASLSCSAKKRRKKLRTI